jgi:Tfp pilus assembly protein PilF
VHIWSESYDRDISEIFKVQDEVATAVVGALQLKLAPTRQPEDPERSDIPEAYNQYLLGKQLNHRGNLAGYRDAAAAHQKAIALDPGYAVAYAALSMNESSIALDTNDTADFERARVAAEKAISLSPETAAGYRARGALRLDTLDFLGGRADEEQALKLSPGDSRAQNDYGYTLAAFGRLDEAIATMRSAIELDPLNSTAWSNLGLYLTARRDFPAARSALERSLAISPNDDDIQPNLASLSLLEGRLEDATANFLKSPDGNRETGMALVAHSRGDERKSQHYLDELIANHASDYAYQIAEVYA